MGSDETLRQAAGELFTGWTTPRDVLEACCIWVEKVRRSTPILESYTPQLREVLFSVTQDQGDIARELGANSWPRLLRSLGDQCRRQSVALNDLRSSIQHEQITIDRTVDRMYALEWQGALSHDRIDKAHGALACIQEADDFFEKNPGVLDLLLPDTNAALSCIRAIATAQSQVKSLPIQAVWRDRLNASNSISAWVDFQSHVSQLEAKLAALENVTDIRVSRIIS